MPEGKKILRGGGGRVHRVTLSAEPVPMKPTLTVSAWEAADPAVIAAARKLEREGVCVVNVLPPGVARPARQLLVVDDALMADAPILEALDILAPPGAVLRAASERPVVRAGDKDHYAFARERLFTEVEIEKELRPWIEHGRAASAAVVKDAEDRLAEARRELDEARTVSADEERKALEAMKDL